LNGTDTNFGEYAVNIKDKTAIVGVGLTDYYRRGQSGAKTHLTLCLEAILKACDDAGIKPQEIDGFASYRDDMNAALVAPALGAKEVRFSNLVWGGGGGGSCAAVGNAAAAIHAGYCDVVAIYHGIRQPAGERFGETFARPPAPGGSGVASGRDFIAPYGLMSPGQMFALMVRRHMHLYGTTSEHLGHVAITQRLHARRNPKALRRDPMTMDDYFNSRMISDPFRLFDYCNENDGAGALILVSAERARDLKQKPAYVMGVAQGGAGGWGNSISQQTMPEEIYATAGHGQLARDLYKMAGVGPEDIDVAELYDHFTGMVLLQLEDYGFCKKGESGPLAASGALRWDSGEIPVNTHGGNLSEVYLHATTHMVEGVKQLRGTSTSQVKDAELVLVTGGPSPVPSSSMILRC